MICPLRLLSRQPSNYPRARALSSLADTHLHTGRFNEAGEVLRESLSLCRSISSFHEEAGVRMMMARLAQHHGDAATWRRKLEQALSIYTDLKAPQAAQIAEQLVERQ